MAMSKRQLLEAEIAKKITLPRFLKWLEKKGPKEVVGVPSECENCPIANFMISTMKGASKVSVGGDFSAKVGKTIANIKIPAWADLFITKIDNSGKEKIPASFARRVLREIKKELASKDSVKAI